MTLPDTEILTSIVGRVFRVEEFTSGDPKRGYFLRYRGELTLDSIEAYDQLAAALLPYDVTPLFRIEDSRQTILLIRGTVRPKPGRTWVNLLLFALTVLSVMFAGTLSSYQGPLPNTFKGQIMALITHLWVGWPFAVSLLGILLAHEFGHYFVGKAHGAAVSLPYFIPLPLSPLGTMGAFIQMKQLPRNKRALFDLAIAGPLAGLGVAIPVLLFGLSRSHLSPITAAQGSFVEGNSILYLLAKFAVFGKLLPQVPNLSGLPLLFHWISYFFIAQPSPVGSLDVMIDPIAWAGWAGLLVTFLNLIPAGQLDGGHVIFTVFGRRVNRIIPFILAATVLLGFFWSGWWLWAFLIFVLGRTHAEPLDQITRLDRSRKILAVLMLVIFLLVLMPVPMVTF
jgi:membrane-associated protease RseP (regulator of RpoE activity)